MTDTFFDKPINGTISHYSESLGEQHDPNDLINALDAIVMLPEVAAVRWTQYTPYFNDGEACIFGANAPEVLLVVESEDDEDYDQSHWHSEHDLFTYGDGKTWEERRENGKYEINGVSTLRIKELLGELEAEMDYHQIILSDKFGDPAEVVYDGETFIVEHYDHD